MDCVQDMAAARAWAAAEIQAGRADCVLLRGGERPVCGSGHGVRPLLTFLRECPQQLCGATVVDRVVGKAAAMLAVLGGAAEVYALTASETALAYLAARGLPAQAQRTVPHILDRTGSGLCPLEASVQQEEDPARGLVLLQAAVSRLAGGPQKDA